MSQPDPETRGGDEPASWGVDGSVIAQAAAIRAQLIATTQYMGEYDKEPCGGVDTA